MRLKATLNATRASRQQADHKPENSVSKAKEFFLSGHGTGLPAGPREAPCRGAPTTRGAGLLLLPINSWVPPVTADDEVWMLESSRTSAPTVHRPGGEQRDGGPHATACRWNGCPPGPSQPPSPPGVCVLSQSGVSSHNTPGDWGLNKGNHTAAPTPGPCHSTVPTAGAPVLHKKPAPWPTEPSVSTGNQRLTSDERSRMRS